MALAAALLRMLTCEQKHCAKCGMSKTNRLFWTLVPVADQQMLSLVPIDVHLWTCITCINSMALACAVVHSLGHRLSTSSLFIGHLRTLNSCGAGTKTKKTEMTGTFPPNTIAYPLESRPTFMAFTYKAAAASSLAEHGTVAATD